jgi:hypothetical protein
MTTRERIKLWTNAVTMVSACFIILVFTFTV